MILDVICYYLPKLIFEFGLKRFFVNKKRNIDSLL